MKKFICLLCTVALLIGLFTVDCFATQTATSTDITAHIPDSFKVYTKNSLPSTDAEYEQMNCTPDELKRDFSENGYVFVAFSPVLKCTIFLSEAKTAVSSTLIDLYAIEERKTIESARSLLLGDLAQNEEVEIKEVERNCALFFRAQWSGEDFHKVMYVTVINSTTYTLCLIDNSGSLSENGVSSLESIFNTLEYSSLIEQATTKSESNHFKIFVNFILLIAAIAVAVIVIVSLVRDYRIMKLNTQRDDNVKIRKKPRR